MKSLYELASEVNGHLTDILFVERANRTQSLLTATGVLPIKRKRQNELLHLKFCGMLVLAFDSGGEFKAQYSSTAYNSRHSVPSTTHFMLRLMVAQGLLEDIGTKQYRVTGLLKIAVGPLDLIGSDNHDSD